MIYCYEPCVVNTQGIWHHLVPYCSIITLNLTSNINDCYIGLNVFQYSSWWTEWYWMCNIYIFICGLNGIECVEFFFLILWIECVVFLFFHLRYYDSFGKIIDKNGPFSKIIDKCNSFRKLSFTNVHTTCVNFPSILQWDNYVYFLCCSNKKNKKLFVRNSFNTI